MPMKFTVTLTSVGTSSVIVMPKPILDGFGLKKGDQIELFVTDDGIMIPMKTHLKETDMQKLRELQKLR